MPRTILTVTEDDRAKLRLLEQPFRDLSFLHQDDKGLIARADSRFMRRSMGKPKKESLRRAISYPHCTKICTVLDALEVEDAYERVTGIRRGNKNDNSADCEECWDRFYVQQFQQWQEEQGLNEFGEFWKWPKPLAGWYHLNKFGQMELTQFNFNRTMALALLGEVLHEHGATTLAHLAALPLQTLYRHMQASGFDNPDEQLTRVREFLGQFYIDIETVIEE